MTRISDNISENEAFTDSFIKAYNAAREHFISYGVLDQNSEKYLSEIFEEGFFEQNAAKLLLENYYRCGRLSNYFSLLSKERENFEKGLYIVLQDPDNIFFNSYIKALSTSPFIKISKPLIEAYVNFRKRETLSLNDIVILLYLCTYIGDEEYVSKLFNLFHDDLSFYDIIKLGLFRSRFFNERMGDVYDKLLTKTVPDHLELRYFDAMHLTPLHYAIMTRNEDIIKAVLASGDWYENPAPFDDRIAGAVYDYVFEAVLLLGSSPVVKDVVKYTRYRMKPLFDSRDKIKKLISINNKLYEKSGDIGIHERIEDLRSMGCEIDDEINSLIRREIMDSNEKARLIFETNHAYACFVIRFFQDKDSIYNNVMKTFSSCRLYRFRNIYFLTPSDIKMNISNVKIADDEVVEKNVFSDSSYTDRRNTRKKNGKYKNPFFEKKEKKDYSANRQPVNSSENNRSSFFSHEAHTNINVLKKEYHSLVKKYHPDTGNASSNEEIMREIIEERSIILSGLSQ